MGDRLPLKFLTASEIAQFDTGFGAPDGPALRMRIVGIARTVNDGTANAAEAVSTPALARRLRRDGERLPDRVRAAARRCRRAPRIPTRRPPAGESHAGRRGRGRVPRIRRAAAPAGAGSGRRDDARPGDRAHRVRSHHRRRRPPRVRARAPAPVHDLRAHARDARARSARRTHRPGAPVSRLRRRSSRPGSSRRSRSRSRAARSGPPAASPGRSRIRDGDRTSALLVLGGVAVTALLVGVAALAGIDRRSRATRRGPSATVGRLAASGAPAPVMLGARFALEPGRGRSALPVRSALLATVIGLTGVAAVLVWSANLEHLVDQPASWGWRRRRVRDDVRPDDDADPRRRPGRRRGLRGPGGGRRRGGPDHHRVRAHRAQGLGELDRQRRPDARARRRDPPRRAAGPQPRPVGGRPRRAPSPHRRRSATRCRRDRQWARRVEHALRR